MKDACFSQVFVSELWHECVKFHLDMKGFFLRGKYEHVNSVNLCDFEVKCILQVDSCKNEYRNKWKLCIAIDSISVSFDYICVFRSIK